MGNVKSKKKKYKDEELRKGLKRSTGFAFGLFVNVLIVYLVVKIFSYSFNFAYKVFGDTAKEPGSSVYSLIEIPADSSTLEIGEALEDGGIIDDKLVFMVKVKVKGYGSKIVSGKYGLSPNMTYNEIINIICHIDTDAEEDE